MKAGFLEAYLILWIMAIEHQGILRPLFSHLNHKVRCGDDVRLKTDRQKQMLAL